MWLFTRSTNRGASARYGKLPSSTTSSGPASVAAGTAHLLRVVGQRAAERLEAFVGIAGVERDENQLVDGLVKADVVEIRLRLAHVPEELLFLRRLRASHASVPRPEEMPAQEADEKRQQRPVLPALHGPHEARKRHLARLQRPPFVEQQQRQRDNPGDFSWSAGQHHPSPLRAPRRRRRLS